ncbi:DUF4145 domain-containing protein [Aggregatimonas sangjinii]|uniref:DUF4145 domain-containing protein n=1 Tax=Aggregatimonas sangjinii TaxID=2583587 RepID=A0A5B7SVU0_9FLAO|nr:DUF4145 domain-containing protein [Aggregatimonas sangjinii]QCX01148.1 DUF4145 domain-containing protein [Aggregatimonas sangjinii]
MDLLTNTDKKLFDNAISCICPHCGDSNSPNLTSTPKHNLLFRHRPKKIGMAYLCNTCKEPLFFKFKILSIDSMKINISDEYEVIENPKVKFDYEHLPEVVKNDFKEALGCYTNGLYNAFAAMCRRTIQSSADNLGAEGKSKVQNQINELKELGTLDDETYEILKRIILDGHDGAHPHLPALSLERAEILLELLKDVLHQLFIRKGRIKKAARLRTEQLKSK